MIECRGGSRGGKPLESGRVRYPGTTLAPVRHVSRKIDTALLVGALLCGVCTPRLAAQISDPTVPTAGSTTDVGTVSFWSSLAGERAERRRFIFGLWALHPFEPQFPEVEWTQGFGITVSHWFAATFVNSYDERSFIVGVERYWARGDWGITDFGVGYRVGLVTGYDERLVSWAEYVPVLPFAGLVGWIDAGPLALDVYYVYRAITLETAVRF